MSWAKLLKTKTPVIIRVRLLQPEVCEARRNLTAASLVWPELRFQDLCVLRVLWLHCGRGRNVAAASPRFWLQSWPTWRNSLLSPTQRISHTRGSEVCVCVRVRHHLPHFADVRVNVQKQSLPPSWLSWETADPFLKITGVKFYLHTSNICKVMGSQNNYLASFLVSHKQHRFQSEKHI